MSDDNAEKMPSTPMEFAWQVVTKWGGFGLLAVILSANQYYLTIEALPKVQAEAGTRVEKLTLVFREELKAQREYEERRSEMFRQALDRHAEALTRHTEAINQMLRKLESK